MRIPIAFWSRRAALFTCASAGVVPAPGAAAQDCPDGRITYVFVDNHSIFDTSEAQSSRFLWAYQLANRVHFRTRASFIESELLFRMGDCFDPFLLQESERILREHRFIAQADVYGIPQPDGSHHVVVDTNDEWTTNLSLGFGFEEGFQLENFDLNEENLLGRGILVGLKFREKREIRDAGVRLETPRLFSSRWDAAIDVGETRNGTFLEQGLYYPFVAEIGRVAARQRFRERDSEFAYASRSGAPHSHVVVPYHEELFEATSAFRLGRPGNLTVLGVGVSREVQDFGDVGQTTELVLDGNFDRRTPASPELVDTIRPQASDRTTTRINFLIGQRNIRFVQRRGLDAVTGVQDVPVGTDFGVVLGRSVGVFGQRGADLPDDLYTRFSAFLGFAPGELVLASDVRVEARHVYAGGSSGDGWRDVLGEFDTYFYWQPRWSPANTLFARLSATSGWSMETPFQLTLGGRESVRGYHRDAFPGGRRILVTIEDRMVLDWAASEIIDLGASFFLDAGKMISGDVPFGADTGWRASVGAGLRLGFPAGTRSVLRLDLAYPLEQGSNLGDLVFRVTLKERVGLLPGFDDPQSARSRAAEISPRFVGIGR